MKIALLASPEFPINVLRQYVFDNSNIYLMKTRDDLQTLANESCSVIIQFPNYDHVILNAERIVIPYYPEVGIEDTLRTINLSKIRNIEVRLVPVNENI